MEARQASEIDAARRLERGLVRVRWFGLALGIYLTAQTNQGPPPFAPDATLVLVWTMLGLAAVANVAIGMGTNRIQSLEGLRRLGLAAFALDAVVIFGSGWAYSYDPNDLTWVVIYLLPLEGALRYQVKGALAVVALTFLNETAREAFLAARFDEARPDLFIRKWDFEVANIAFRVGLQAIIAAVAGFMALSLARQRDRAEEQARLYEEVANREAGARGELTAFNTAILSGVAATDLETSTQAMAEAIGPDLGFETLSILVREGDTLVVKGMYGMPFYGRPIRVGEGVTGTVAATATPLLVPDVRAFPSYIEADPEMRSEMAAPMRIGDEVVGVVDVESRTLGAFDEGSLDLLVRLADQLALVVYSNRMLSQQRETMQRLQDLDQMKSDFVAIVSHELRTPITAIRGFVKTLLRTKDQLTPDQVSSFLEIIDRQSERLARLIEDLLVVSRIEAGRIRVSPSEVNLRGFLKELVDSFGPERRNRVWLEVDAERDRVMMDPDRVDQILRNLVENALKFSPQDSQVFLTARADDGVIEFSVADQGPGIPLDQLPMIFDRFHQAGRAMTREAEGAGLGLYITKRLVEAMGGQISVESSPGQGSTFRVRLTTEAPGTAMGMPNGKEREPVPAEPGPES